MTRQRGAALQLTLQLEPELMEFVWLYEKALAASRAAREGRQHRAAEVFFTFDQNGRLHVRYRAEERPPADGEEPDSAAPRPDR